MSTTTTGASSVAVGAAFTGALAAYVVTQRPDILQVRVDVSWTGLALLALAGAAVVLVFSRPAAGLCLLAALVYLNASEVLVREHRFPSFLQLLSIPLLLAASADRATAPLRNVLRLPLTRLLGVYLVLVLASGVVARDSALADERLIEHAKLFLLYVTVAALASARTRLPQLAWTLVGAGTLLSAIGVVQTLTGDFANEYGGLGRIKHAQLYDNVFEPRIAGPLGDPNFFAQILLIAVALALALARWDTTARRRLLGYGTAALSVAAVVLTYSRGGALALACVAGLSLADRRHRWRDVGAGAALLLVTVLMLPDSFTRRLDTLQQLVAPEDQTLRPDSSFEKRRQLVSTAWLMFLDHPIAGVGVGNYTARFDEYADDVPSAARDYDDPADRHYPHSLYLEVAAETGLLGLGLFGAVCAVSLLDLVRARELFRRRGEDLAAGIARGLAIALLGYLLSSVFLHGHFLRHLWLLFAAAAAVHLAAEQHEQERAAGPSRPRELHA